MAQTDHVIAEATRQLVEQRAQSDAYSNRAGVMIAALAVLTGILAGTDHAISAPALWMIGGAAVLGVLVLWTGRINLGVSPSELARLRTKADPFGETLMLESALLIAIEANARALIRTELLFTLQAFTTIAGVALLVVGLREVM